jgi:two-component system chemotaxis response regulator CheY
MKMMFQVLGYNLRAFENGRNLSSALLAGAIPDLLFLDSNMPELSGFDFLQFIRSRSSWRKLPVLIMSTESQDVRVEQSARMGADGYVFKPINLEELENAINTAVEKRRTIAEGRGTGPLGQDKFPY